MARPDQQTIDQYGRRLNPILIKSLLHDFDETIGGAIIESGFKGNQLIINLMFAAFCMGMAVSRNPTAQTGKFHFEKEKAEPTN